MGYSECRRLLRQAMFDNKLVVFVGAGASVNSGIPLWKQAVKQIHSKLESTSVGDNEFLKVPQFYFNARGEKEYNELIKTIFKYDDKKPNEIHRLIVELNSCSIITTNYDNFLERSFSEKGEFLEVVERDSDIPYKKSNKLIIKMHGGFVHNNFVLKEDDYLKYSNNFPLIETYVKAMIAKNVVLFVGYSYNDPDIKQIMTWVQHILKNHHQRAYMLDCINAYDYDNAKYYENLGINILYAEKCKNEFDFNENDVYANTLNFLKYIVDDKDETDIINKIYSKIHHYEKLNYVLEKDIVKVLNNTTSLSTLHENRDLRVFDSELTSMFRLFSSIETTENEKLQVIRKIFNNSGFLNIYSFPEIENIIFEKEELIHTFSEINEDNFFNAIDTQNMYRIKNFANEINHFDDNTDRQDLLKVAYAYYFIKDYNKCYHILKSLSSKFMKEQNYIWYFICEFNRKNVGKMFNTFGHRDENINNESKKIELESIIA